VEKYGESYLYTQGLVSTGLGVLDFGYAATKRLSKRKAVDNVLE
jgi:hypothetical protein